MGTHRISGGYVDYKRLLRLFLAGAVAGLVIFAVFNPGLVREEEKLNRILLGNIMDIDEMLRVLDDIKKHFTTPDPYGAFMFTASFAAMLGGLLVIMDETSSSMKRVIKRALLAAAYGIAIGGSMGVGIDFLCTRLARIHLFFVLISAIFGWPLIGLAAGASVGLTLGSWRRAKLAMLGGLIGGFFGGQVFGIIGTATSAITGTGSIGRVLGFIAMGAIIGASVAIIEDMGKRSWVTILNGPREGKSYILSKDRTTIGRDELADIPLFGDSGVAKQHASLLMQGYVVTLHETGGHVAVNGVQAQSTTLRPWDVFTIGGYSLRFHQKGQRTPVPAGYYAQQPYAQQMPHRPPNLMYGPPPQTIMQPAVQAGTGNLALVTTAGPHINTRFGFGPGTVRIGREMGCGVFLPMDIVISRTHAELSWNGTIWVIRDLQSRNGLWVNGVRVTEHALRVGDQIGVGQSWLRVEGL